jgi:hypothetical protein
LHCNNADGPDDNHDQAVGDHDASGHHTSGHAGEFAFEEVFDAAAEARRVAAEREIKAQQKALEEERLAAASELAEGRRQRQLRDEREEEADRRRALAQVKRAESRACSDGGGASGAGENEWKEKARDVALDAAFATREAAVAVAPVVAEKAAEVGSYVSYHASNIGEKLGKRLSVLKEGATAAADTGPAAATCPAPPSPPTGDRRSANGMAVSPSQIQGSGDEDDGSDN